jgi:hypothetical protein
MKASGAKQHLRWQNLASNILRIVELQKIGTQNVELQMQMEQTAELRRKAELLYDTAGLFLPTTYLKNQYTI